MKKVFSLMLIILSMLMLLNTISLADGMVISFPYEPTAQTEVIPENEQYCFINYNKDSQSMFLSINFKKEDDKKSVWIFPVPAEPSDVIMNVLDADYSITGEEVIESAKIQLDKIKKGMLATQIYPLLFEKNHYYGREYINGGLDSFNSAMKNDSVDVQQGVTVHEKIEKMGLRTELITAIDEISIKKYLESNGVTINEKILNHLKLYTGQKSTFVVSWILDENQYNSEVQNNKKVGVNVVFPTKKLYFPLKLTSIYESVIVPANIYVLGHVSPDPSNKLKQYLESNYYINGNIDIRSSDTKMKDIMLLKDKDLNKIDYTKITINAPSKVLSEDLNINKTAPIKIIFLKFIAENAFLFGLISVIIISMLLSVILGKIFYKEKVSFKKLLIIGLTNIASIIGLFITNIFLSKEEISDDMKLVKDKTKQFNISAEKISICGILGVVTLVFVIAFLKIYDETAVQLIFTLMYFVLIIFLSIDKQAIEVLEGVVEKYIILDVKKIIYGILVFVFSYLFLVIVADGRGSETLIVSSLLAFVGVLFTIVFVNKWLIKYKETGIVILNKVDTPKLVFPLIFSIAFVISTYGFISLLKSVIK